MDHIEIQNWSRAIDHVLRGSADPDVVVGPVQWNSSDGALSRQWFFLICTCGTGPAAQLVEAGNNGLRCDKMMIKDAANSGDAEVFRARFIKELNQRDLAVHDMESELEAARLCEQLWPGPRITEIRRALEGEATRNAGSDGSGHRALEKENVELRAKLDQLRAKYS